MRTFRLVAPGGGPLPFTYRAGQYLNLSLVIDGTRVNRSYTIASAPTQAEYCGITVKKASAGWASHHLHDKLAPGALVEGVGPSRAVRLRGEGSSRVLLVAGGVGITPLVPMVRTLTARTWRSRIDLVYSVKTRADIVFERELEELTRSFPTFTSR